ncbi:MAG TPA: TetR/AcrR family transcriptional regulator [Acidiferrobacterales bacterium]|jgi:AcrR family transcriptional regulator
MESAAADTEETREAILNAAQERFRQVGYSKTTMAEIAKDCSMSAANLYRYFENKLDIGTSLACQCLGRKVDAMKTVVARKDRPAAERLAGFIQAAFQHTHEQITAQPRIHEMVEAVCLQQQPMVHEHQAAKQAVLEELLRDGVAAGEFSVDDPGKTAAAILAAMTLFEVPIFWHLYEHQHLVELAEGTTRLILRGVLTR